VTISIDSDTNITATTAIADTESIDCATTEGDFVSNANNNYH
jgi:hypothetical protein